MSKIIGLRPALDADQQQVVALLQETLDQALAGSITSVGLIVCMKNGYATMLAGRQAADINLGCDSLKKRVLDTVEGEGQRRTLKGA